MAFRLLTLMTLALMLGAPGPVHASGPASARPDGVPSRPVATYSIVARDGATGQIGVAVQSHWFDVGGVVPWAKAGVGAVATQSLVRVDYGPNGLALMADGMEPRTALDQLVEADEGRAYRQVGMIDAEGRIAQHTGDLCIRVAEQAFGENSDGSAWAAQANMMTERGVALAMSRAFNRSAGTLAERLLAALNAGEAAGGDIRGMQSAAILVVEGEPVENASLGVVVDLSVEDDVRPLIELGRLLNLHTAYEHMNAGDMAIETGDVDGALQSYSAAMELAPDRAEMVFWTAVSLTNAGRLDEAEALFGRVYENPGEGDWRELLRRLPASDLFPKDRDLLDRMLDAGADDAR